MSEQSDNSLIRVVVLFPAPVVERLNKLVHEHPLPTSRSDIVREIVLAELDRRDASTPGGTTQTRPG
jgi:metal-responsive CopG/Arc/MetJ family transcriptional regulator